MLLCLCVSDIYTVTSAVGCFSIKVLLSFRQQYLISKNSIGRQITIVYEIGHSLPISSVSDYLSATVLECLFAFDGRVFFSDYHLPTALLLLFTVESKLIFFYLSFFAVPLIRRKSVRLCAKIRDIPFQQTFFH